MGVAGPKGVARGSALRRGEEGRGETLSTGTSDAHLKGSPYWVSPKSVVSPELAAFLDFLRPYTEDRREEENAQESQRYRAKPWIASRAISLIHRHTGPRFFKQAPSWALRLADELSAAAQPTAPQR